MIHESIKKLAKPIDAMLPLEGNPRRGDIDAIAASYSEFGQVKPIVVKDNGDETFTVIAGNHQVAAARKLGWSEIAAVVLDADDKRAVAFALADNRTMELGHSDQAQVIAMIEQISSEYPELLSDMRWDEFEIAAMDEWVEKNVDDTEDELNDGYVPPTFVGSVDLSKVDLSKDDAGETKLTAKSGVDSIDAATRGSTAVGASTGGQAVVQYTLVFDSAEQQRDWYSFIRFLRSSPVYEGDTTAERLMSFIQSHADF